MARFLVRLANAVRAEARTAERHAEFERSVQARLFWTLTAFLLPTLAFYITVNLRTGQHLNATLQAIILAMLGVSVLVARRTRRHAWPLRIVCTGMFVVLSIATVQQGLSLPAAGWWLSIVPFVLAGGGLHGMAILAVAAFIAIVTGLYLGWIGEVPAWLAQSGVPAWRRYLAVVGSELLALSLILLSMRSRRELAEALDEARRASDEAAALKARFISNMSHEIRTPLNGILGAAELLDSPRLSDAQRTQLIALQRQSGSTLLSLVNDVLDFAKLEAGRMTLESVPVDMRALLFEANALFSVQAYGKGTEVSSSCNPDVPERLLGDPLRLRQIVTNLVSNAVKFTAGGAVHLHAAVVAQDPAEPARADARLLLRIEVADSGTGMTAEQQQRLFHAFAQGDDSVSRRYGGTGLGLAISQELARLMGGRIEVQSAPGRGSSFALTLPMAAADAAWQPRLATRRNEVCLAVASRGLERHVKCLLHELNVEPRTTDRLPDAAACGDARLVIVDLPLLQGVALADWAAGQRRAGRRVAVMTPLGGDTLPGGDGGIELLFKPVRLDALRAAVEPGGAAPAARTQGGGDWRHLVVLVAEDNPVNQVVVQALFAELGITVTLLADGIELLDGLQTQAADLAFVDLQMPRLGGIEAVRRWRAAEAARPGRRVWCVAMTAAAESEEGPAALAAGMDAFLSKPFGIEQLRASLAGFAAGRAGLVERS